jgi:uncharacterized membrane protein
MDFNEVLMWIGIIILGLLLASPRLWLIYQELSKRRAEKERLRKELRSWKKYRI